MAERWECALCGTTNAIGPDRCIVCGTTRTSQDAPRVSQVQSSSTTSTASGQEGGDANRVLGDAVDDDPSGGTPRRVVVLAAVVLLIAGIAAGVAIGRTGGGDDRSVQGNDRSVEADTEEATTTSEPPSNAPNPVPMIDDDATAAPAPTVGRTTPATAPPTSAAPPTAPPVTATTTMPTDGPVDSNDGLVVDPAHRVRIDPPDEFTLTQPFDGSVAVWESSGTTLTYEVIPNRSVADADARRAELVSELGVVTYNPESTKRPQDGRYVVSGTYEDGGGMYERGKIRCGDLVRYRFDWDTAQPDPAGRSGAEALVDDDENLDSMGGVHAAC